MSLDLEHMVGSGRGINIGYQTFAEYRRLLARDAAGIDLDAMAGFGGDGDWPQYGTQPLVHLLRHSDCEGWLYQFECEDMRPVLDAFTPPLTWPTWARDYHEGIVTLIRACADDGGVIQFA